MGLDNISTVPREEYPYMIGTPGYRALSNPTISFWGTPVTPPLSGHCSTPPLGWDAHEIPQGSKPGKDGVEQFVETLAGEVMAG